MLAKERQNRIVELVNENGSGAAVILAQLEESVIEMKTVLEKICHC